MEEPRVRFTGNTTPSGGHLRYSCKVEYLSKLDPFLPAELKTQRDLDDYEATVLPFNQGHGGFAANTLEQAKALEAQIKVTLQTAYQAFLEWRARTDQWASTREHDLVPPQANFSPANDA